MVAIVVVVVVVSVAFGGPLVLVQPELAIVAVESPATAVAVIVGHGVQILSLLLRVVLGVERIELLVGVRAVLAMLVALILNSHL